MMHRNWMRFQKSVITFGLAACIAFASAAGSFDLTVYADETVQADGQETIVSDGTDALMTQADGTAGDGTVSASDFTDTESPSGDPSQDAGSEDPSSAGGSSDSSSESPSESSEEPTQPSSEEPTQPSESSEEPTQPSSEEPSTEESSSDAPTEPSSEEPQNPTEADFEASLLQFPESYRGDLRAIHAKYPNWIFKPVNMSVSWEDAVKAQCVLGVNQSSTYSPSSWKSTQPGAYNWDTGVWTPMDGPSWVQCSEAIVRYYLDPRNYMDSTFVFAFLDYAYDANTQTVDGLRQLVAGTHLAGTYTENGVTYSYVDQIMKAAAESGMNPYLIASTVLVENGINGTGRSISGTFPGYEGYYNFFNIGAYTTSTMTAVQRGLWYASNQGTGQAGSYYRPWNNRYASIVGGASYYAKNFISRGQNTIYSKKFNYVNGQASHQYMGNIQAVSAESKELSLGYTEEMKKLPLVFCIPVYPGMPSVPASKPYGDGSPNNKLDFLGVDGYYLSPTFSTDVYDYTVIAADNTTSVYISASPKASSASIAGAGTVTLKDGLNEFNIVVTAQNGDVRTYHLKIAVSISSGTPTPVLQQPSVAGVTVQGSVVRGLSQRMTASQLTSSITVADGGSVAVKKSDNATTPDYVGTGNIVSVYAADGSLTSQYTVVLYGDANGDGRITSSDLLRIQKSILRMVTLGEAFKEAADANHDGRVTSGDLLRIQKAILGMTTIAQ